jgi:hypothetical protein
MNRAAVTHGVDHFLRKPQLPELLGGQAAQVRSQPRQRVFFHALGTPRIRARIPSESIRFLPRVDNS